MKQISLSGANVILIRPNNCRASKSKQSLCSRQEQGISLMLSSLKVAHFADTWGSFKNQTGLHCRGPFIGNQGNKNDTSQRLRGTSQLLRGSIRDKVISDKVSTDVSCKDNHLQHRKRSTHRQTFRLEEQEMWHLSHLELPLCFKKV